MWDRFRQAWKRDRLFFVYILVITLSIFLITEWIVIVWSTGDRLPVNRLISTSLWVPGIILGGWGVLLSFRKRTPVTINLKEVKLKSVLGSRHKRAIYLVFLMAVGIVGIGLTLIWWQPVPSWVEMRSAESSVFTYRLSTSILTSTITMLLSWTLVWIFYKPAQFKATREKLSRTLINNRGLIMLILLAVFVLILAMVLIWELPTSGEPDISDESNIFNDQLNLTIAVMGAFSLAIVAIFNFNANNRRANTAEIQQAQELYVNSIKNLGSDRSIIRIGAVYGLERLAKDSAEVWKDKVAKILCARIRETTRDPEYQTEYKDEPSVEVLTIMEALSTYDNPFASVELDLKGAYLVGLNLMGANLANSKLNRANLSRSDLKNANLTSANLYMANLKNADLTRTVLSETILRCARLTKANLNGALLNGAKLEGSFSNQRTDGLITEELTPEEIFKLRENQKADLTGCIFTHSKRTSLNDVYCGAFTKYLANPEPGLAIRIDLQRFVISEYRREPTEVDKELLVGNENMDKCIWGNIIVFGEKDDESTESPESTVG